MLYFALLLSNNSRILVYISTALVCSKWQSVSEWKPSSAPSDSPSLSGKVSLANQSFCSCDVMHSLIRFSSLFLLSFCITKTDEHRNNRPIQPLLHTSTTHQLSTPPRPPNLRPLLSLSRNRRRARCTCRCPTFAKLSHHLV